MGQIPEKNKNRGHTAFTHYCIVGNGRLARHLAQYFSFLHLPFVRISESRRIQENLQQQVPIASHFLLAVSDSAIKEVFQICKTFAPKSLFIHFSGALSFSEISGAHPLMTFSKDELYSEDFYRKIPFVFDNENPLSPDETLPELPNPTFSLPQEKKAKYHALVSIAGNFPAILWSYLFSQFTKDTEIPRQALGSYLMKTLENTLQSPWTSVTGPIVREDWKTIQVHLDVLKDEASPLSSHYYSFLSFYEKVKKETAHETQHNRPGI